MLAWKECVVVLSKRLNLKYIFSGWMKGKFINHWWRRLIIFWGKTQYCRLSLNSRCRKHSTFNFRPHSRCCLQFVKFHANYRRPVASTEYCRDLISEITRRWEFNLSNFMVGLSSYPSITKGILVLIDMWRWIFMMNLRRNLRKKTSWKNWMMCVTQF